MTRNTAIQSTDQNLDSRHLRSRRALGAAIAASLACGALSGCAKSGASADAAAPAGNGAGAPTAPGAPATTAPVMVEESKQTPPPPVVVKDVGLQTPESVLYVPEEDVYLVSNVNGTPVAKDDNGFISKVAPDGKVVDLKWIDASKPDVKLDAPKGMAISGTTLYVADITVVRRFDSKTGAAQGEIAVPGAKFLNDISAAADGTVYVSDMGVKLGKKGFEPAGTEAIYTINPKGAVKKLIGGKELGQPNGLLADDTGVWAVTFASNELYHVGADGKRAQVQKLPKGSLDGIVKTQSGALLISSWENSAVYRGFPGGVFEEVVSGVGSPADIGYDGKRHRVVVPLFQDSGLHLQDLTKDPAFVAAPAEAPTAPAGTAAADPAKGATPATPAKGAEPAKSATPAMPATAAKGTEPAKGAAPAAPATPTTTGKGASPATPASPAKGAGLAAPASPATPAKPAPAATPATPAKAAGPAAPAVPATPAKPAAPAAPAKPAAPAAPAK